MNMEISAAQLSGLGPVELVDIREADEVAREPLPCEHRHIPMDQLLAQPDLLKKDRVYVLVCAAGVRTRFAALHLRERGYHQVYSLIGGNRMVPQPD